MFKQGEHIALRAIEPSDLDYLFDAENDEAIWEVSNTVAPYSRYVLKHYLDNAHRDIYEVKQLRLAVLLKGMGTVIGFVDLFDFEPKHRRAGLGIVIFDTAQRGKGHAAEAIKLMAAYAREHLNMHQLYANIVGDNTLSTRLFERCGFVRAGEKKDWIFSNGGFKNELLYQLVLG
ncbi:MAG: GNAT family N-acetyltransferase [Marinirhabdus sp.]